VFHDGLEPAVIGLACRRIPAVMTGELQPGSKA
jgi:hypothetical protein